MGKLVGIITVATSILLSGCTPFKSSQPLSGPNGEQPASGQQPSGEQTQVGSRLDLSGQNLTRIPEYVFSRADLEELDVSSNQLTGAIQAEIRHLQNLKVLRAGGNRMTGVPAEIGQLRNLEVLDLSSNQLTGLPLELGNLQRLKTFNISGNSYSEYDLSQIEQRLPSGVNVIK
jgi:Leucine-rich repeat (LRR) protein